MIAVTPKRTEPARVTVRLGRQGVAWAPGEDLVRDLLMTGQEPVRELVRRFALGLTAEDPGNTFGPR